MPLNENALITLDTAKSWLGLAADNLDYDFKVEMFINSASDKIAKFLGYDLVLREYTDRLDGNRNTRLLLRNFPVASISSLSIGYNWNFDDPMDSENYTFTSSGIVTLKKSLIPRGNCNIQVVYTAGYVTPFSPIQVGEALPSAITMACIEMIKWLWNVDNEERYGKTGLAKAGQSTSFIQGIPLEITGMIREYMNLEFETGYSSLDSF